MIPSGHNSCAFCPHAMQIMFLHRVKVITATKHTYSQDSSQMSKSFVLPWHISTAQRPRIILQTCSTSFLPQKCTKNISENSPVEHWRTYTAVQDKRLTCCFKKTRETEVILSTTETKCFPALLYNEQSRCVFPPALGGIYNTTSNIKVRSSTSVSYYKNT